MVTASKNSKKELSKRTKNTSKPVKSRVITVRISDEEKVRIDGIMMNLDINRYSDVMRLALHMIKPEIGYAQVDVQ